MSLTDHINSAISRVALPINMPLRGGFGNADNFNRTADTDSTAAQHNAPSREAPQEQVSAAYAPLAGMVQALQPSLRRSVLRAGHLNGRWSNPFVSAAMPAILRLQEHLANTTLNQATIRSQLVLEIRLFRESLQKSGCVAEQVNEASYALCTYLDEVVSDHMRIAQRIPYEGERSLLVEFHGDSWGGENAFVHLERSMRPDNTPLDLLGLYEVLLALGLQGRYRMLERGDLLLQDLRSHLHVLLWHSQPEALGELLPAPELPKEGWWTLRRIGFSLLGFALLLYLIATFELDARGRPIRNALAAWEPPTHIISPMEALPVPVRKLVDEGWLTASKHPQGWLLVFRSDRAFPVGLTQLRPEFLRNIDRLGQALAPWSGDLEIIGHTDAQPIRGSQFQSNQALSEARARVVADRLRQSVTPSGALAPANAQVRQLFVSGRGDSDPIDTGNSPAAYERNRRVDVFWKLTSGSAPMASGDVSATDVGKLVQEP